MPLYKWSPTAAANATADPSINWSEGQAPSSVNDSARAMMAAIATARQDTQAVIGAGGTASALTYTSGQGFSSLALMDSQLITFVAPLTNAAGATLNVDSLGAIPICVDAAGTPIPAGVLVGGTPYMVTYYNSISQFRLWNLFASPYNIPLGGMMPYIGATAPNSNFAFPFGQAISRTTYAALFALTGTAFGVGDGSTTFNIPDLRGRVAAGRDDMGGSSAARLSGALASTTLGAVGGTQTQTLLTGNLPPYTPSGTVPVSIAGGSGNQGLQSGTGGPVNIGGTGSGGTNVALTPSASFSGNAQGGTSTPVIIVQPTIICNHILRII